MLTGQKQSREYPRMTEAFICDAIRTPVGRYGGGLAAMRIDDLAAHPIGADATQRRMSTGARSTM